MVRRWAGLVAALLVLEMVVTACGAAGEANPEEIGPRGVDELVIPTPDPDPADFVDTVDNPWLPLAAGTAWTYDVADAAAEHLDVRVEEPPEVVAGVSCTVVTWTTTDHGARLERGRSYYAQDRRGNVWLFGEEGHMEADRASGLPSWRAGELGAEAGIAMLADPRVGDGYVRGVAGNASELATILSVDDERSVTAGTFGAVLMTEDRLTVPQEASVVRRYYAEGVGLVEETTVSGGSRHLLLRSVTVPSGG